MIMKYKEIEDNVPAGVANCLGILQKGYFGIYFTSCEMVMDIKIEMSE